MWFGPDKTDIRLYKEQVKYSPYPSKTFPNNVYFGDAHLHTSYSTDAGMTGTKLGPEEALRFARGEEVISNHGLPAKLIPPLDFLVVADHAENLGLAPMIESSDPLMLENEFGKKVHHLVKAGKGFEAYELWITGMFVAEDPVRDEKMRRTHATCPCQDPCNRTMTAVKKASDRIQRIAFLPAIPHQRLVGFGVIDSRSILH